MSESSVRGRKTDGEKLRPKGEERGRKREEGGGRRAVAEEQQQGLLRTRSMDYGSELDARAHPPYDLIWQLPLRRIMIVRTMLFVALSDNSQRPSLTIQSETPCHTKYALGEPIRQEARLRGPKACSPDTWSATWFGSMQTVLQLPCLQGPVVCDSRVHVFLALWMRDNSC